jgi:hypothetical protein
MPFSERVRRLEIENAVECEICRDPVTDDLYLEIHSVTSLHLVKNNDKENPRYIVTSPPPGHEHLKGKSLDLGVYKEGVERGTDAACLCLECHQHVHRMALKAARKVGFKGKNPPPQVLEQVTRYYLKNGMKKKINPEKNMPVADTDKITSVKHKQDPPPKNLNYFPE